MKKKLYIALTLILIICISVSYYCYNRQWVRVNIQTTDKSVTFLAEPAITDAQKKQGLMFRKSMSKRQGMLFTFDNPQIIYMWMKNTYIPLDMIFINDNEIVAIYQNAKPLDQRIISSAVFASAVLEINAGMVKEHNIRVGDKVRF